MSKQAMLAMLTPKGQSVSTCIQYKNMHQYLLFIVITCTMHMQVVATNPHPSVNKDLLTGILKLTRRELEWKDIEQASITNCVPHLPSLEDRYDEYVIMSSVCLYASQWQINPPSLSLSLALSPPPSLCLTGTKIKDETELDMLRSIMLAQLEFFYTVRQYDEHMYWRFIQTVE